MTPICSLVGTPRRMAGLITLCVASTLAAQIIRVDPGGRGDYRLINDAVRAAPEGATLLLYPGFHTECAIRGKSLTVVGAQALVTGGVSITGLGVGQRVRLLRVVVAGSCFLGSSVGSIAFDDVDCTSSVRISACQSVRLTRCKLGAGLGAPSLSATNSRAVIADSEVIGGNGGPFRTSTHGGRGAWLVGCDAYISHSRLVGGDGAQRAFSPPGDGGDGIYTSGGRVQVVGCTVRGGVGGADATAPGRGGDGARADGEGAFHARGTRFFPGRGGASGGTPGRSLRLGQGVVWSHEPGRVAPWVQSLGVARRGRAAEFDLTARPGSVAILAVGVREVFAPLPVAGFGAVGVQPVWLGAPRLLPRGTSRFRVPVPGTAPEYGVFAAQFFVVEPDGLPWAVAPATVLIEN